MGKLLYLNELGLDATWYFTDAWLSTDARRYKFDWPSPDFPNMVTMHSDDIYRHNDRKIKIRKFIDSRVTGVVILDTVDYEYKKYYGKSWEWDKYHTVSNTWYRYHFEDSESALAFSLTFNEWVRPITKWHPKRPEDEEYLALPEDKRYKE
jgi:hypothetical protein